MKFKATIGGFKLEPETKLEETLLLNLAESNFKSGKARMVAGLIKGKGKWEIFFKKE